MNSRPTGASKLSPISWMHIKLTSSHLLGDMFVDMENRMAGSVHSPPLLGKQLEIHHPTMWDHFQT